ncbi:MAG: phosphoribosylamine--glycine ligase [Elusimicrobiota bacterium]|jgi:phosphoribosylamine--glycine ligase|nr:phosphoribosylamine--glycine ligase [Elusimicrobiota bacterium]
MKILVIGSGAREHCICWKFAQSHRVEKIYCAGANANAGISSIAQSVDIDINDFEKLARFSIDNNIDFTFVGPEIPLSAGIVDYFESKGLKIAGPSKEAAQLESSKTYAKRFMQKYGINTAKYSVFFNSKDAYDFLDSWDVNKKIVVKADGLAAGKGVYICQNINEAKKAVKEIMETQIFGFAGSQIVIEEFIEGRELSYLIFTDGKSYSMMPAAQDHKRVYDNDEGPNTGGMGAYAPAPLATQELNKKVEEQIIKKVMYGLEAEKLDYKGVLYIGIIMNGTQPFVLEFNCRFGDPETQAVLPLLDTDLVDICLAILDKKLSDIEIKWKKQFAVCIVAASGGYPNKYQIGFEIKGLAALKDIILFHYAAKKEDGKIKTAGGRVLALTALSDTIQEAIDKAYKNISLIDFEKIHYRKDIAKRLLE